MTAILLDVAWKSVVVLGITLALLQLLRQRSAAQRAWIAHIGLVATLALPLAVTLLQGRWEVAAAAPLAQMAQPVTELFEAPAVLDMPAMAEEMASAAPAAVVPVAASSWLSTLLSILSEPANLAAVLYGLPAALLLLVMLVAVGRLFALRARALVMVEQSWLTALAHAQRRMNFKHGTALLISNEIHSPVSWGVLRPVILLNEEALAKSNDAEAIIAHELAHVARLDWASLLLARVATALFWFNPLVWLVARQAHQLREEAADDSVLRSNVNHLDYAALLVGAARHESRGFLLAANGVAPSRSSLKQRITRVLDQSQLRAPAYLGWMGICVLGAATLALPLAAFSATATPERPVAPLAVQTPAPVHVAQAAPVPPLPPAPRAPEAVFGQSVSAQSDFGDWNGVREKARKLVEREQARGKLGEQAREEAQELAEREREKAQDLAERERERAQDLAERERDRLERRVEREQNRVERNQREAERHESVTIDVPGAFIHADPQGAIIRAPGVHIEANSRGTIVRAPGVNIQAGPGAGAGQRSGAGAGAGSGSGAGMRMAQAETPAAQTRMASVKPSADELIQMSVLGIDQRYRDDIAQAGYPGLSTNQLQQFKIHNVRGAWLRDLAALGYSNLTVKQVANMAIHNVSADFVRRVAQATSGKPTPEKLIEMRILGVGFDDRDKNKNKNKN